MKARISTTSWKEAEKAYNKAMKAYNESHDALSQARTNEDYDAAKEANLDALFDLRRALREMTELVQITIDDDLGTII